MNKELQAKYPCRVWKKQETTFNYIKKRVWQKLSAWKGKLHWHQVEKPYSNMLFEQS